jgi:hypothetical protein
VKRNIYVTECSIGLASIGAEWGMKSKLAELPFYILSQLGFLNVLLGAIKK